MSVVNINFDYWKLVPFSTSRKKRKKAKKKDGKKRKTERRRLIT